MEFPMKNYLLMLSLLFVSFELVPSERSAAEKSALESTIAASILSVGEQKERSRQELDELFKEIEAQRKAKHAQEKKSLRRRP
jgi:hypothetical protein